VTAPRIWYASVWEDGDCVIYARLMIDDAGTLRAVLQSDLATITYTVWDGDTLSAPAPLTIASVIFNTLQMGTVWTQDSTGYNFRVPLAAALFPAPDKTYAFEFKFTLTGGTVFWLQCELRTVAVRSS